MKAPPLSLLLAITLSIGAQAGSISRSPDTAVVSTFSTVKWKQLRRLPSSGALVASITFSNEHYVSDNELPREERTDFVLPGVQWDARTGTYTMKSASGARTAVATVRRRFSVEDIELLPGARLCLVRTGSTVSVQLVSGQPMHRENRSVEVIASWPD